MNNNELFNYTGNYLLQLQQYYDNKYIIVVTGQDDIWVELARAPTYEVADTFIQQLFNIEDALSANASTITGNLLYWNKEGILEKKFSPKIIFQSQNIQLFSKENPLYKIAIRVELKDKTIPCIVEYDLGSINNKLRYEVPIKNILGWIDKTVL